MSGAYNQSQTYYFAFSGEGIAKEEVKGLTVTAGEYVGVVAVDEDGKGEFTIPQGNLPEGGKFSVVATVESQDKIKGNEAITLTIDNQELSSNKLHPNDTAQIDNFVDCVIDGLVEDVTATGLCVEQLVQ